MSTSGERWAYFEGSAYLLDFRCFLRGRGDDAVTGDVVLVATLTVVLRDRLVAGCDVGRVVSSSLVEPFAYRYFAKWLLKALDGGDDGSSGGSDRSLEGSSASTRTSGCPADRVRGIAEIAGNWS